MMLGYDWHFERLIPYTSAFEHGISVTLLLSFVLIIFSTTVGVSVGASLRYSKWWSRPADVIIDLLRGLPPLVIILFGYYLLSEQNIGISVPAFWVFVVSVGLNIAAFIADLTRASLTNVPQEYVDTASTIGLTGPQIDRYIVFPFAVREMIPPLSYLYIETVKITSLASVISVRETVYVAGDVIQTLGSSLEVWVVVAAIYLVVVYPMMIIARILERNLKRESGVRDERVRYL